MVLGPALSQLSNAATATAVGGQTVQVPRPISAVAPLSASVYARFVQPVRASATAVPADAPTIELADINTGAVRSQATALEGPLSTLVGTARGEPLPGARWLWTRLYDGLRAGHERARIVPLEPAVASDRPTLAASGHAAAV